MVYSPTLCLYFDSFIKKRAIESGYNFNYSVNPRKDNPKRGFVLNISTPISYIFVELDLKWDMLMGLAP
jgi:hypothetical protein